MTPELIARYGRAVPRYTSYPAAPHFSPEVGAEEHRRWLNAAGDDGLLSLYLHVPFCRTLCWFCGCHTKAVNRYSPIAAYVEAMLAEIDAVAGAVGHAAAVSRIHFGGGSPTMLSVADFERLVGRLRDHFHVLPDAEISIEIDPRRLEKDSLKGFAAAGVTRASIGVQDIDPAVQRAVNRIQPREVTESVVDWCREAGIEGVNIDLMYGLPHQTVESVAATAAAIAALVPDRIALFGYAHVPWVKPHQKLIDERALADAWERWRQSDAASEALQAAGYRPVGMDHFALATDGLAQVQSKGRLRRNFQGYTDDQAHLLVGLGASAISDLEAGYVQNVSDISAYRAATLAGGLATAKGIALDAEDRLRRAVIERLMCDFEVDLAEIASAYGAKPGCFEEDKAALHGMVADGLVEVAGDRVFVSGAGRPLIRVVAAAFDAYLGRGPGQYSRAV